MLTPLKALVILVAIAVGLFRPVLIFAQFNEHLEASYQAIAHILVGGLFAWHYATVCEWRRYGEWANARPREIWLTLACALTCIEIVCFAITLLLKSQGET